jgi:hypothetical protein
MPGVPPTEYLNMPALQTLTNFPGLFCIKSLIDIDHLQSLLSDHPNTLLVDSICRSLHDGFWPWADTKHDIYPVIWDNSNWLLKMQPECDFVAAKIAKEVKLGRCSQPFGPSLHLGMYSLPLHTIPKEGSDGLRLINDQSAGEYSLNSMISCDDIARMCMDGIKELGVSLWEYREQNGNDVRLVIWKSDIHRAYRNLPIHPLYQLKQVISLDGNRYVDHCNCFGNRAITEMRKL